MDGKYHIHGKPVQMSFGINDVAIWWLQSHLLRRSHYIRHRDASSTMVLLYCRFDLDDFSLSISECVGTVSSWMKSNCDLTEVLRCASGRRQHQLPSNAPSVDDTLVEPVKWSPLAIWMFTLIMIC